MKNNNFSRSSINNMKFLQPNLILFFCEALIVSKWDFGITCGIRTNQKQNKLYQQGRTLPGKVITYCDGYKKKSRHQINEKTKLGHAGDIKLYKNGHITWKKTDFMNFVNQPKIRALMKKYNIEWGGDWKNFIDLPHFQIKER